MKEMTFNKRVAIILALIPVRILKNGPEIIKKWLRKLGEITLSGYNFVYKKGEEFAKENGLFIILTFLGTFLLCLYFNSLLKIPATVGVRELLKAYSAFVVQVMIITYYLIVTHFGKKNFNKDSILFDRTITSGLTIGEKLILMFLFWFLPISLSIKFLFFLLRLCLKFLIKED